MGSNHIISVIAGALLVITALALWPLLNSSTDYMYTYFRDACERPDGLRFTKIYGPDRATPRLPSEPDSGTYYMIPDKYGGPGFEVVENDGGCFAEAMANVRHVLEYGGYVWGRPGDPALQIEGGYPVGMNPDGLDYLRVPDLNEVHGTVPDHWMLIHIDYPIYALGGNQVSPMSLYIADLEHELEPNNHWEPGFYDSGPNAIPTFLAYPDPDAGDWYAGEGYRWVQVSSMFTRFAAMNSIILSMIPVVAIASFLGISGLAVSSYGRGQASIASSVALVVFTLIGIVVPMIFAIPVLGSAVTANQVIISGQYQVNGTFGNIVQLLFAMVPTIYIVGLLALVGTQLHRALTGVKVAPM